MDRGGFTENLFISKPKAIGSIGRMWADNCPSYWVDSYVDMINFNNRYMAKGKDEFIHYIKATASWHEMGRNQLVENMLGDWLLMVDTDHCFAPDILMRLYSIMVEKKIEVLGAVYQYKFQPHNVVAGNWVDNIDNTGRIGIRALESLNIEEDIQQVGVMGAGCLLVKKRVFDVIRKHFKRAPFDIVQGFSEDYSFFWRCKELNIPVYLAPKVECHHVIPNILSIKDLA